VFTLCWSVKGGSGTTVIASALALISARTSPTILVDLGGDAPAALGLAEPGGPGVFDWLSAPNAPGNALLRLGAPVVDGLHVVRAGGASATAQIDDEGWQRLADACTEATGSIVIDAGTAPVPGLVHERAAQSLLVIRPCYLALRRATQSTGLATGVVLISEPGRALGAHDVQRTLATPVLAEIAWDPAIARSVDAGLLAARLPNGLARSLRRLCPEVAAA
jgi:hypothetical protein